MSTESERCFCGVSDGKTLEQTSYRRRYTGSVVLVAVTTFGNGLFWTARHLVLVT